MFTPTNCLDALLLVAIIIHVTSYSRDIGSISKDDVTMQCGIYKMRSDWGLTVDWLVTTQPKWLVQITFCGVELEPEIEHLRKYFVFKL